jgi:hypothetical protein
VNFRNQIIELLDQAVTPFNAAELMAQCASIERENRYIPSDFKWILDYKRFQAEIERGAPAQALVHLKNAIALAPYREQLLDVYRKLIEKTPGSTSLVLIVSCKRYEANALRLAGQLDAAQVPYLIVSGDDTAPIAHPRAFQVGVPDNYESLPRKVTAAFQWIYENVGTQVGVLKLDDDQTLVDGGKLLETLTMLKQEDVYAGFPVTSLTHDRNWHWNKCEDPMLNRRTYGKPFFRPWARGGAYFLGAGPLETFVFATMRFPGLLDGEYYEDKMVGDVLGFDNVPLVHLESERDFGLSMDEEHRFVAA